MYILDVIPLANIGRNQSQILSYFYNEPLSIGAVVEISLNRKKIKGVVVGYDTLKKRKLGFKKNVDFELKNISRVLSRESLVEKWQLDIAMYLSSYYYVPLGLSLKTVLPPFWGKKGYCLGTHNLQFATYNSWVRYQDIKQVKIKFVFTNLQNHYLDYENEVKKHLAEGKQVFLMVAENVAADYFLDKYSHLSPKSISSRLSNKKYHELWKQVESGELKLIIGTRVGLFLPFSDLGLIIIDDESNEAYKSDMTPRYNGVDLAQEIARNRGAEILSSAVIPRLETYYKIKEVKQNIDYRLSTIVVNMISELKAGNFSIFSRDLKSLLANSITTRKNVILYIPRRGYANFIYCQTCGKSILCPNCSVSLVEHESQTTAHSLSTMVCHHCNHSQPRPKQCPNCGGYSFKTYGIGIQKVEAEVKKFFKYQNMEAPKLLRLDSDSVKTEAEENEVIDEFNKNKGIVLLATQKIFSHKYLLKSETIGIINADTLINIPDFRAEEILFRDLLTISLMGQKVIIQTHNPTDIAIKMADTGNVNDFFRTEIENRKEFSYPPFSKFIKLSYKHKDPARAKRESMILAEKIRGIIKYSSDIKNFEIIGPNQAFIIKERGHYIWNIILKIRTEIAEIYDIKQKARNNLLRAVMRGWIVDVDPRNIT